jgi:hypothetical protein
MKISTESRPLVAAQLGLTIAAFAAVGCAADDLSSKQEVASLAAFAPAPTAASPGNPECAGDTPTLTLFLETPDGNERQLVHFRGCGWKYRVGRGSDGGERAPALQKAALTSSAAARVETAAQPGTDPLAVFIDGPTGYAFTWTRDSGWTFAGHIADGKH